MDQYEIFSKRPCQTQVPVQQSECSRRALCMFTSHLRQEVLLYGKLSVHKGLSIKYRLKSNVVVSALKVHFGICNA